MGEEPCSGKLDISSQIIILCFMDQPSIPSNRRPFAFTELQTVTSLGRGEIRECIHRGIITAPAGVGQGNHRAYTKWNLVEGVIAASLLRQVRAGAVAHAMTRLQIGRAHV